MSITEIMKYKNAGGRKQQLSIMLAMHSAPLLRKSKISNIVTIKVEDYKLLRDILEGSGISYRLLKCKKGKVILFLYRKEDFRRYLNRSDVKEFLEERGYDVTSGSTSLLSQLTHRIYFYKNDKVSYPHEIGVFLGYPLCDVRGFCNHKGCNARYCGYWKVYGDVASARRKFEQFEDDREVVVRAIMNGASISEIAS